MNKENAIIALKEIEKEISRLQRYVPISTASAREHLTNRLRKNIAGIYEFINGEAS